MRRRYLSWVLTVAGLGVVGYYVHAAGVGNLVSAFSTMGWYLLVLLVAGPLLAGYGTALRYFVPVIIATLPAAMCLAALHLGNNGATGRVLGMLPIIAGLRKLLSA